MRNIFCHISGLMTRYRLVPRAAGRLSKQGLLPIAAVLPIVAYAYMVQSVVTTRTELHERQMALQDLRSLSRRIGAAARADAVVCGDYAHWDDTYGQMPKPDKAWLSDNFDSGIGSSFGIDAALLVDTKGNVVWQSGGTPSAGRDLARYALLKSCLSRVERSGIVVMDGRAYMISASPILTTSHKGPPKGMLVAARAFGAEFLAQQSSGSEHKLALYQTTGQITPVQNLGPMAKLPRSITDMIGGRKVVAKPMVAMSTDGMTCYGVVPIKDVSGKPIGAVLDVTSRASLMQNLGTIRHMSVFLMAMCAVFGVAGISYFRNRALAVRAHRDELTGLYNHGYLQESLKTNVQLAERYDRPLAVMMADLDHFKYVNDTHGHATGDHVLKWVSECIVETVRATDVVARYGGEEFVIVLPETTLDQALVGAERLRGAIERKVVHARSESNGQPSTVDLNFTISIGVAAFPDDGADAHELLMSADAALAEAKRTRNRACAYQEIVKVNEDSPTRLAVLDGFLRDSSISTIRSLVAAIDTRDPGSAHHSEKVAEYAVAIGRELGFLTQDLAMTCKASLVHDIGKIGIPDHVLTKSEGLTSDEFGVIKQHSKLGADILANSPALSSLAEIVMCHHERQDGTGYPRGLSGDAVPLISRVIGVADSLDAMTSSRSYKQPKSLQEAIEDLTMRSGGQFDPVVVEAAVKVIARLIEDQQAQAA